MLYAGISIYLKWFPLHHFPHHPHMLGHGGLVLRQLLLRPVWHDLPGAPLPNRSSYHLSIIASAASNGSSARRRRSCSSRIERRWPSLGRAGVAMVQEGALRGPVSVDAGTLVIRSRIQTQNPFSPDPWIGRGGTLGW